METKTEATNPSSTAAAVASRRLEQPILIRPARDSDRAYVFSSWLHSYKDARAVWGVIPGVYFLEQQRVIERLWKSAQVLVACDPEIDDALLGWACGERWRDPEPGAVLHFVYVKGGKTGDFRKRGIGRRLVEEAIGAIATDGKPTLFFSHLPAKEYSFVAPKLLAGAYYNPYMAFPR